MRSQFYKRSAGFYTTGTASSSIMFPEVIISSTIPLSKRRAVVAKHNRDIPPGTLLSLLREARFSRDEFIAFLEKN